MSDKPLVCYSFIPRHHTASSYYRIQQLFECARDLGLPFKGMIDTNDAGIDPETRIRAFCEADAILLYQPIGEPTLHNARLAKSFLPSLRDGDWKYPPTLIVDSDDNLFNVNPKNPAYRTLGIRDPDGKEVPAGHVLGEVENGVKKMLWHDSECSPDYCGGEPGKPCQRRTDFTRNRQNLETYRGLAELADVVTCTTSEVAKSIQKGCTPQRTEVFPNLIRFNDYPQIDLMAKNQVRILWQGGASHFEDWYPLRDAMGEITKKYTQVHWVIWGQMYHWAADLIPPDRYTYLSWCPYHEYKLRRVMIGEDISLAPLADNHFNRCRSAIKWYEASVSKRPAATLAQNTGPYKAEIEHGKTGMLFDNPTDFVENLSKLIVDREFRREIASNAKDWVRENRDAMREVPKWMAFLEEMRETAKKTHPHMPPDRWEAFVKQVEAQEAMDGPVPTEHQNSR